MTYLWTTKNTDSIDVPNFGHQESHILENHDTKSENGNRNKNSKHRVASILRQIDEKSTNRRNSAVSVTSSSHCDEVSVLSLHSAFLTNKVPIQEDAEFTTPLVDNGDMGHRSFNLTINPSGSTRSLGLNRRSYLKSSRHTSSSSMTFSSKSLPISQDDIECVEKSWIDNHEDEHHQQRSSSGSTAKRRFSTQTYSDKGTVYSSIYKSFCDEESSRSVASSSFNARHTSTSSNFHGYGMNRSDFSKGKEDSILSKQQAYNAFFQSNRTVGNARICPTSDVSSKYNSTPTSTPTFTTSHGGSQYDEEKIYPPTSVPNNTPTSEISSNVRQGDEVLISNAVEQIKKKNNNSSTRKKRKDKLSDTDRSLMSTSSKGRSSRQSFSSSKKSDDTLLHQNSKSNGRPPLSTKSSSSSLTDETTESKVQKELYRLSLELASTLSSLDFKKLEVAKYAKQVGDLERVIAKLVVEKEQLQTKLERYGMKERNAHRYKEKDDNSVYTSSKKSSKKKTKKNKTEIVVDDVCHTQTIVNVPNCVTPTNEDEMDNMATPMKSESTKMEESDLLFPDLNESHLTCQDLYATMEVDDEDDGGDEDANDDKANSGNNSSNSIQNDKDDTSNDEVGESDDFSTDILDTTVSLIDPREEVFDDDPFATFYDNGEGSKALHEENGVDDDIASLHGNRSVISLQWIPFMNKDTRRAGNHQAKDTGSIRNVALKKKSADTMNSSFRSTKTNMTAPVKKSNFFGFVV